MLYMALGLGEELISPLCSLLLCLILCSEFAEKTSLVGVPFGDWSCRKSDVSSKEYGMCFYGFMISTQIYWTILVFLVELIFKVIFTSLVDVKLLLCYFCIFYLYFFCSVLVGYFLHIKNLMCTHFKYVGRWGYWCFMRFPLGYEMVAEFISYI